MISLIEKNKTALGHLCERHHVRRLELFGSALVESQFDVENSDLDFLVEFLPLESGQRADSYFGLLEELEALFKRPVDLVVIGAIKNPYFRQAVNKDRALLYAA